MKILAIASLLLLAPLARAEAPLLLSLEIDETNGQQHHVARHVVSLAADGTPGELKVDGPGPTSTTVKLRVLGNSGTFTVEYDVSRHTADHTSWIVHSETALPPLGTKVVIARLERASGPVELRLQAGAVTAAR